MRGGGANGWGGGERERKRMGESESENLSRPFSRTGEMERRERGGKKREMMRSEGGKPGEGPRIEGERE